MSIDARSIELIEAMMHMEYAVGECSDKERMARMWAAHYLVQAYVNDSRPSNFDEVLATAREYDAVLAAEDAIRQAKRPA